MKRLIIGIVLAVLLCSLLMSCSESTTISTNNSDAVAYNAWINQSGSGMFFGTAPDLATGTSGISTASIDMSSPGPNGDFGTGGTLNVLGLNNQFPDGTQLWLKYTCPGNGFGSQSVIFRIEKILKNEGGQFITTQVTDFSIPVDSDASIVRFEMPLLSIGPGTYAVEDITTGQKGFWAEVRYLAPGESPDPNFLSY